MWVNFLHKYAVIEHEHQLYLQQHKNELKYFYRKMMKNSTCGHSNVYAWKLARGVIDITWSARFRTIHTATAQTLPIK